MLAALVWRELSLEDNLLFEGSNVDILRTSAPLSGRKFIGKGSSSEIYDGGDSIFRLSTDGASHTFVVLAAKQALSVPRCLNDWGRIMPSDDYPEIDFYWLAEFEKLHELECYPKALEEVKEWVSAVLKCAEVDSNLVIDRHELGRVHSVISELSVAGRLVPVKAAMSFMCVQCLKTGADLDFDESNFMVRPGTGEILVTDPAHGL